MKKDKEQASFVNIGSSSLLIVFLILCMATFAILSLSSAKSDYSHSEKLAEHKSQYYKASSEAEEVLDIIDEELEKTAGTDAASVSSTDFLSSHYAKSVIKSLEGKQIGTISLSCHAADNSLIISYQIPLDEKQALDVALEVVDYTNHDTYYKIQKWKIVSTGTWESDDTLNLMPIGE